jgi:hypothetical protein
MRFLEPQPRTDRTTPRHCEAITGSVTCGKATREGKAYCPDHVEHNPYVAALLAQWSKKEDDDEVAKKNGAVSGQKRRYTVNLDGITAQDLVAHLRTHGPRTEERLCRELHIDLFTLRGYIGAMRRKRMVALGHTKRGSTVVKLVGDAA